MAGVPTIPFYAEIQTQSFDPARVSTRWTMDNFMTALYSGYLPSAWGGGGSDKDVFVPAVKPYWLCCEVGSTIWNDWEGYVAPWLASNHASAGWNSLPKPSLYP